MVILIRLTMITVKITTSNNNNHRIVTIMAESKAKIFPKAVFREVLLSRSKCQRHPSPPPPQQQQVARLLGKILSDGSPRPASALRLGRLRVLGLRVPGFGFGGLEVRGFGFRV